PGPPTAEPAGAPPEPEPADEEPGAARCFQIQNSYIVEERADGIAIIDQHALHERILFNSIRDRIGRARLESQRLLVPAVVELGKADAAGLLAEQETLAVLGIELSEFGPDSVAVNALPAVLSRQDPAAVVHDLLAELSGDLRSSPVEARKLAMAKRIACKAAVKAGDRLTPSEMRSLLERAQQIGERDTCPHGRPTCIVLPYEDLERQFERK
ncbi:MAG: DNA mismatch repair protein MutL, partial [bacterium]